MIAVKEASFTSAHIGLGATKICRGKPVTFTYQVSLTVRHPEHGPADICAGVGLPTKRQWKVGEPRSTPKGRPLPGIYTESYCVFDIGHGEDGALADCLREAVSKLKLVAPFLGDIKSSGGKTSFYITWEVGETGETFDAKLLSDIARLGIDLDIDPLSSRPTPAYRAG